MGNGRKYYSANVIGLPMRMIGTKVDIREYRHLEEQVRQAQKMSTIGRLACSVAHDLNHLLTIITGNSELLQAGLGRESELQKYATEVLAASSRAARLTRQLLALSRQQVSEPCVLNLNEVVTGMEQLLRRLIGEDIKMVVNCQANVGTVRADPAQIEQVIMNLAVNSRDAMPKGGILTIETASVILDQSYMLRQPVVRPGPHVVLTVTDTGHGMDRATMSRLFEPFFTTKERGKGTGLGLAIVHGIVMESNGNIGVDSEVGRGTAFKVYLPCVGESVAPAKEPEVGAG